MVEKIKGIIATILDCLGILKLRMYLLNHKSSNYIRVINYHRTLNNEKDTFERHLIFYSKIFQNINYDEFCKFKNGELVLDKPGIMITFDDGLKNNYEIAVPLLKKYGFTGYFFVSTGKIGSIDNNEQYMSVEELNEAYAQGHYIGCHTYSHHRMSESDTDEVLNKEIVLAKNDLEKILNIKVDTFCWCGGEFDTYTNRAAQYIRNNYLYSFMTNNYPVFPSTNNYQLQRTNVEARWSLPLVKFQICEIMDDLYRDKRNKVIEITKD